MNPTPPTLTDGVICLAPPVLPDAVTVMAWDADPEVQRWFDWPLTPTAADPETHAARLASAEQTIRRAQAEWRSGKMFLFIIRSADTDEGIGWIDLQPREDESGNVAYAVLPAHRRRGVATRAVILASGWAFETLGWARLEIRTNADNAGSRAVALGAGYRLERVIREAGIVQKHEPFAGQRFDEAVYSRLRTGRG